ncbi:MAG TPA: ABC transporter permease, partial [Vicinamibacterales bacterium]|nr:ABC transporter permease [Vicinamibacterales bacterium]
MRSFLRDLRIAGRRLRQDPAFTSVAVLTLALGIAATAAIFTVVQGVVLRPLPYPDPGQLVRVTADLRRLGIEDAGLSPPELFDYRDRSGIFDDVAGIWPITANLTGTSQPERVETLLASPNYFRILGARPQLGRLFGPVDHQPGIAPVVVISDGLWRRGFGADPRVIGRTLRIDLDVYEVIGVTEPGFRHPSLTLETDVEVWAPTGWSASPFQQPRHSSRFMPAAIGRLKRGLDLKAATARLEAFGATLRREFPTDYPDRLGWVPRLLPLKEDLIASARPSLLIVMAAVIFVLLIGCANIANLQLARTAGRGREIAVRLALGASGRRIVREQLAESLLVAFAGAGLGIVLTLWALDLLMQLAPVSLPRRSEIGVDWTVAAFSIAVSIVTALAFGLAPAVQAANPSVAQLLKGTGRTSTTREHTRVRRALIVAECAVAVVLLVAGALLVRSFWHLQRVDPGFDPHRVTIARVWLPQPNEPSQGPYFKQDARARLFRSLLDRLEPFGGSVGLATNVPLAGAPFNTFTVEGWPEDATEVGTAQTTFVTNDYFRTLGIPLVGGRVLDDRDNQEHPRVIVVNETMARTYWPNENAVGKRIRLTRRGGPDSAAPTWITVVGVVGDTRNKGLDQPVQPHMYGSMWQISSLAVVVAMRAHDGVNVADLLRREVRAIDPDLPVYAVRPLESIVANASASRRFAMVLVGLFGVAALVLAALGIYGVIAYAVNQQRQELGIRLALGAPPTALRRRVLLEGLRLTAIGLAIGVIGAITCTRVLSGLLFGVGPNDPMTFAAIVALLLTVAVGACWIPARRAASVDPVVALR